jgi:predicted nucleic acid-binding protein
MAFPINDEKYVRNLPDAIIGATAIAYNAQIVTSDEHFSKCQNKNLQIWKNV